MVAGMDEMPHAKRLMLKKGDVLAAHEAFRRRLAIYTDEILWMHGNAHIDTPTAKVLIDALSTQVGGVTVGAAVHYTRSVINTLTDGELEDGA